MKALCRELSMNVLMLTAFLAMSSSANAQTPFSTENVSRSADKSQPTTQGISAANPWLGAQVAYKFGGTDEIADNLIVSARLLYEIDFGTSKFRLPVMGNISDLTATTAVDASSAEQLAQKAQALVMSATGARVGLYPYYVAYKSDVASVVFHGEAAWKLNALEDPTKTLQYLQQLRFSGGIEFGLGKTDGDRLPLTVSVTPTVTVFSAKDYAKIFGEEKSRVSGLEITGVIPVAQGVGFLLEGVLAKDANALRAGLVLAMGKPK